MAPPFDAREAERLLRRLATAQLTEASGSTEALDLAAVFAHHRSFASPEPLLAAREAAQISSADEEQRSRARKGMALAARLFEAAQTASLDSARLEFELRTDVRVEGEPIAFRDATARIANEPDRARRGLLARARDGAVARLDGTLSRLIALRQEAAGRLGFASYAALWSEVGGVDLAALTEQARRTLDATEDAYRDLMSFGLRKTWQPLSLRPKGEAAAHDLERFARLQPLDDLFAGHRLQESAQSFLEGIGVSPAAGGRIELDLERHGRQRAGATVAAISCPGHVAIALGRIGGAPDYAELLGALGRAHFLASGEERDPVEERCGSDATALEGFGRLFEHLLLDPGFLKRKLGADPKDAVEAARLLAIRALLQLRLDCAQALFERELYEHGPTSDLFGYCRELKQKAALADWPIERWLFDVGPGFSAAHALAGRALEALLHRRLLEDADEDHWRNPRMGALLRGWWAKARAGDATGFAKTLGGELAVTDAAARLVEIAAR